MDSLGERWIYGLGNSTRDHVFGLEFIVDLVVHSVGSHCDTWVFYWLQQKREKWA